jgi:EpsD family peptidyl-prolyl cis-trans isomerase
MQQLSQSQKHLRASIIALALASTLTSCKSHEEPSVDMAAKVDSFVITNQQVSNTLAALSQPLNDEATPSQRRKALDDLINQQLAVSKAEDQRLDREPDVMQAIEEARRVVLARAYLEKAAANHAKPTDAEVHQYYVAHPELFAERRIYTLNELTVGEYPDIADRLSTLALSGVAYPQMVQWLRTQNIPFTAQATARPAEALPLQYLPRLAQLQSGRMLVMSDDAGVHAAQVVSTELAPVAEQQAAPSIRRFLSNQDTKQAVEAEIMRLRSKAKIVYAREAATPSGGSAAPDDGRRRATPTTAAGTVAAATAIHSGALSEASASRLDSNALASK